MSRAGRRWASDRERRAAQALGSAISAEVRRRREQQQRDRQPVATQHGSLRDQLIAAGLLEGDLDD
ncbi:hypothetical protein KF840_23060 [bacterium]|nr:hypothetical protein [bacterium]MBX3027785.1 hypothetical protein [bacterium]